MDFRIALAIQFSGIILVAVLQLFLAKSLKSIAAKYWMSAWLALSCSLVCLYIAFTQPSVQKILYGFYFLGEYVFALMLIAGCANYVSGWLLKARYLLVLAPFAAWSFWLPSFDSDFNVLFGLHSFFFAGAFAASFLILGRAPGRGEDNFGWSVMRIALALLTINFFHYAFAQNLLKSFLRLILPEDYLQFNSIFDLVLEILLGFGMVIVMLERVRHDVEQTNRELKIARDKLEQIAHFDPLTDALNRHAFHGFLQNQKFSEAIAGCVGVFDIDNLKPINDKLGHAAGDKAIRAVANAVRSLIRADDLLFRWGGDEFFVVMFGLDNEQASERMSHLSLKLSQVRLDEESEPQAVLVSYGFAGFAAAEEIESAIVRADEEMYRHKQTRKTIGSQQSTISSQQSAVGINHPS